MKTKILLFNAKWALTKTVRGFVSLVSQTCNQQWEDILHPIKPAIVNDNSQELLKQLQARWTRKEFDVDKYIMLSAQYGRLDCIKTLFEFTKEKTPDKKNKVSNALNESVAQSHNDCAAYLLPHVASKWQYDALKIALKNHNHDFVDIFLNSIETSSPRWNFIVDMMEKCQNIPRLCSSQKDRLEKIVHYMDEQQQALCQDFIAHQQHQRIASEIHTNSPRSSKKKM